MDNSCSKAQLSGGKTRVQILKRFFFWWLTRSFLLFVSNKRNAFLAHSSGRNQQSNCSNVPVSDWLSWELSLQPHLRGKTSTWEKQVNTLLHTYSFSQLWFLTTHLDTNSECYCSCLAVCWIYLWALQTSLFFQMQWHLWVDRKMYTWDCNSNNLLSIFPWESQPTFKCVIEIMCIQLLCFHKGFQIIMFSVV